MSEYQTKTTILVRLLGSVFCDLAHQNSKKKKIGETAMNALTLLKNLIINKCGNNYALLTSISSFFLFLNLKQLLKTGKASKHNQIVFILTNRPFCRTNLLPLF